MRRMLYYFASLFTSAIFMIWSLWQSSSIHGASAIWHKITSQISVLLQREFSSVWDDNVKVDWKRRHKESFYPPQAAECGTRECKAGIENLIEVEQRSKWRQSEKRLQTEEWGWDIWTESSSYTRTQPITQTRPGDSFYLKHWTVLISPLWCDVAPGNRTKYGLMQNATVICWFHTQT